MRSIEWRDEFSIGVAEIDHEHRDLIELINVALENLSHADSVAAVADLLGEIYAKISAHFALEEKIMRERGYDQYDDHKADHERLLDDIRDIMDEYDDQSYFDDETLTHHLEQWFSVHFKTKDARLHKVLA